MSETIAPLMRGLLDVCDNVRSRVTAFAGERPYLSTGNLVDRRIAATEAVTYDRRPSRADLEAAEGDVLFARMANTVKVLIIDDTCPSDLIVSTGFVVLRPKPDVLGSYLAHWVSSPEFSSAKDRLCTGATQRSLSNSALRELRIPWVPLPEQRRIVSILDEAEAARRKRGEAASVTDDLLPAIFLDMFGDPAANPKDWPVERLESLVAFGPQNGIYRPASTYGSGTPIVRIDSFGAGRIDDSTVLKRLRLSTAEVDRYALSPGDILVNRVNGSLAHLGKTVLISELSEPTVFESNMMRLHLDATRMTPEFAVSQLATPALRAQLLRLAKPISQWSINQQDLKSLRLIVPPLSAQLGFVTAADQVSHLCSQQETSLGRLDELFDSLLARAFSGRLTA